MATFSYNFQDDKVILEFKIDVNTLNHYPMELYCENYEITKALCVSNYLISNTKFQVGDSTLAFELLDSEQNENYFLVRLNTTKPYSDQQDLKFSTDCFYDFDTVFENRVVVRYSDGTVRSFRTNIKNRQLSIARSDK